LLIPQYETSYKGRAGRQALELQRHVLPVQLLSNLRGEYFLRAHIFDVDDGLNQQINYEFR
jgi:hypothetical protein